MARNKYPGYCYSCGAYVLPGYGHFELIRGTRPTRWRIKCVKCASGRVLDDDDAGVKWAAREYAKEKKNEHA